MKNDNDPVIKMLLTAEEDDEPLTGEEIRESEATWQLYLRGEKGLSLKEVYKMLSVEQD